MSEKFLCKDANKVTAASEAKGWANELVRREARGPGDMEAAMRRLEARYGIPWRTFWTLRYRPPADVLTGVYRRLAAAYHSECERQIRKLQHEIALTQLITGPTAPVILQAQALVGEMVHDNEK